MAAAGAALPAAAVPARADEPQGPGASRAAFDTLTVEQCIALARTQGAAVQSAAADAEAARLESVVAGYNRRPSWSVLGDLIVAPKGSYDPVLTNLGEYQLKAGAEWPLFDAGNRRRDRERASVHALSAALELERTGREAALRAATVATELLRQRETESRGLQSVEWLENLASLVRSGVRGGAQSRSDAVRVALERDAALAALESARQETDALARELGQILRRPDRTPVVLEPASPDGEPPSAEDSLAVMAWVERAPEARQAQAEAALGRIELEQARRRNALQVGLAADAGLAGADLTSPIPDELKAAHPDATFGDRLRRDLGASVSLQFHRPVLDPATQPAAAAREEALRSVQLRAEAERGERRRLALDLLERWRAAARRVTLGTESSARAADQLVRLKSMYAGGAVALLELLDALRQLDDARERLADGRFESRLARYEAEIMR